MNVKLSFEQLRENETRQSWSIDEGQGQTNTIKSIVRISGYFVLPDKHTQVDLGQDEIEEGGLSCSCVSFIFAFLTIRFFQLSVKSLFHQILFSHSTSLKFSLFRFIHRPSGHLIKSILDSSPLVSSFFFNSPLSTFSAGYS